MQFFDPLPLPTPDAAVLCRLIGFLRDRDPVLNIRDTLTAIYGQPTNFTFFPKQGDLPAWGWSNIDRNRLVLIDGISTQEQAKRIMDDYAGIIQSGFREPENNTLWQWSRNILTVLESVNGFQAQNLTIAGWSAGGAVASMIPLRDASKPFLEGTVRVISFGAPRASGPAISRQIGQRCTLSRYMAFDDPIPNFPPRSGTFTWIPFAVGIRASVRFANFVHHMGGLLVDAAGNVFEATVPTHGEITPRVALDTYWNGLAANSLSAHSLSHYANLLSLQNINRPARGPSGFTIAEHTQNTEPREVQAQLRQTVSAVRDLQATQESQPVVIPRERLARAVRQGKVFYVVINNTPIMMTPTRRRAQGLARDLNNFLRRNQSTAYVDAEALTTQIQAFLAAASDASSGIKPTLSTSIPL